LAAIVPTILFTGRSEGQRVYLMVSKGVTTADTSDLSSQFKKVVAVSGIAATGTNQGTVITAPTISANTTITYGMAGFSLDDIYIVVMGSTA
jgi:hypothetical protein